MSKLDELLYKAKSVASVAGKKTGEVFEVSKMKIQVVQFNSDIDKIYRRIGELTYSSSRNNVDVTEEIKAAMAEIDNILEQIAVLNTKINASQATIKCDNCGATNNADAIFCSRCGKSLTFKEQQYSSPSTANDSYVKVDMDESDDETENNEIVPINEDLK